MKLTFSIILLAVLAGQIFCTYQNCSDYINNIAGSANLAQTFLMTGKNINDLGSFDSCKKTPGMRYFLLVASSPLIQFNLGSCLSNVCTQEDLNIYLVVNNVKIQGTQVLAMDSEAQAAKLDQGGIAVIVVICAIGLLSLIGPASRFIKYLAKSPAKKETLLEKVPENSSSEIITEQKASIPERQRLSLLSLVECFALDKNFEKFLNLPKSPLSFFNGIRALSLFWVIYGHEFLNRIIILSNFNSFSKLLSESSFLLYSGGFFAVDVFFWLSGFLFSYIILEKKSAKNPLAYISAVIHRYCRIIPAYVIGIAIYYKLTTLMGDGPMYPLTSFTTEQCDVMWRNILFIQNFYTDKSCFGWGWYLAVDFQLFLASFVFIVVYLFNKTLGKIFTFLSMIALCFVSLALCIQNNWLTFPFALDFGTYFQDFYVKPWTRAPPYLVGFLLGILYREYLDEKPLSTNLNMKEGEASLTELNPERKGILSKMETVVRKNILVRLGLYAIGLLLINIFIFIPRQIQVDRSAWPNSTHYFFNSFSKILFVFGLSLLFLPSLLGHKDIFGWIMSLDIFGYIARISYVAYIIHYIVIWRNVMNTRSGYYVSDETVIYYTIADIIITLGLSLPFSMLFEVPFMNLEKLLKGKPAVAQK